MAEYVDLTDLEFEQFAIRCQLQKLSAEAGESENKWDGDRTHFFLYFDFKLGKIMVDFVWDECHGGDVYFPTRESAFNALEKIGSERLIRYWFSLSQILEINLETKGMKKMKITDKDQRIVSGILIEFLFAYQTDEFWDVWHEIYKCYGLCDDPFTGLPCSSKEAIEKQLEYEKQVMIERYGHCDGLE